MLNNSTLAYCISWYSATYGCTVVRISGGLPQPMLHLPTKYHENWGRHFFVVVHLVFQMVTIAPPIDENIGNRLFLKVQSPQNTIQSLLIN